MRFCVTQHDAVPTTNGIVKESIRAGAPEGLVVAAFKQTAGYGRQGRAWVSPYGGLYVSFLLRPNMPSDHLSTIALVVALAVRDAIERVLAARGVGIPTDLKVKWPNDVVCARGKLCGISSEMLHGALCIGIGVNVFAPHDAVDVGGKNVPAYISEFLPGTCRAVAGDALSDEERQLLELVRDRLVATLDERYGSWLRDGFSSCVDDFRASMAMLGSQVEVTRRDGSVMASGVVAGLDDAGCLLLRDAAGNVIPVASGEAHIASIS
jgi:BirA family transcriptional regulator, biotin operon repressor / biotin---[acetyl-CoA-carboxylase] ligase